MQDESMTCGSTITDEMFRNVPLALICTFHAAVNWRQLG